MALPICQKRSAEFYRIRTKLGLSQQEVISLFAGGGANSVSRYEQGITKIPLATWTIMKLLDQKPELLKTMQAMNEGKDRVRLYG